MNIFDGLAWAEQQERALTEKVDQLREQGVALQIAAIVFSEDVGSVLYTRLKREAAERVGIGYQAHEFSILTPTKVVQEKIQTLNHDPSVTGIIIQKPWRKTWEQVVAHDPKSALGDDLADQKKTYEEWWQELVSSLVLAKDVDGLHPKTLQAVAEGTWKERGLVLPATAAAVLAVVDEVHISKEAQVCVLGKSDIVGKPLYYELLRRGHEVEMIGSAQLRQKVADGVGLTTTDVVISATGRAGLITGDLLKPGVVLIDVGEPRPDVDRASVGNIPSLITPVPGGIGPMTVVSLLGNCVQLWYTTS